MNILIFILLTFSFHATIKSDVLTSITIAWYLVFVSILTFSCEFCAFICFCVAF